VNQLCPFKENFMPHGLSPTWRLLDEVETAIIIPTTARLVCWHLSCPDTQTTVKPGTDPCADRGSVEPILMPKGCARAAMLEAVATPAMMDDMTM
jgi:hypothetical protein